MPEPFGAAFGAAFGADLAAKVVAKLVSLAAKEVIQAWNVDKDLQKLGDRFEEIGALLDDARTKKITSMSIVDKWFDKLEDVANNTEAFLDELEYEATRKTVKYHGKALRSFISSKNPFNRGKVGGRINSIQASFNDIFEWANNVGLHAVPHLNTTVQQRDSFEAPSQDNTLIVGRDQDISNLLQIVCTHNERDLPVVAIVGMGGQGKTTLARMVLYSDDAIKMFTKRMLVTVSVDFNPINILNQMVESLTSTRSQLKSPQGLVNKLQESLKGEKFLLVLDDVWNEDPREWESLKNSLLGVGGAKGSSVLVTTRNQGVIDAMQNCVRYPVESLQEGGSYELFKKIVFQDGGVSETESFADMGRSMVQRCGGLPLAIKALAGMLRKKSAEDWQRIYNSEIWTSQVLPSLRLSYDNLPNSSLKRCFVYCSIIPKDSWIYKDELIQVWMALGFLLPPLGSDELMEDIGSEYFNILWWHSLLQDIESDEFGNIERCKMHALVQDLALELSKSHSVTMKTGLELNHVSNATYVRLDDRVSDWDPTTLKKNFEKVQVLHARAYVFRDVLTSIKHLTVLVLNTVYSDKDAWELPTSLQNMKYIKYLDISCLRCELPSYITELYNLQTLRVWHQKELPKNFCNLINLRHLYIQNPHGKRCLLYGIDRLTCLQTLPHFVVSKEQNYPLSQLERLHNLRGTVKLYGLGDVPNLQEARKANLRTKCNIQSLLLSWETERNERANNSEDEREYNNECVIEGLEPHTNLKELIIEEFMGKKFASWIREMTNLVKITLNSCKRCKEFPSLGHLPKLREMEIWRMDDLRMIGSYDASESSNRGGKVTTLYPSLTKLRLKYLEKLAKWLEVDAGGEQVQVFPKLEVLEIWSCSKFKGMPDSCFPSLKKLNIRCSDKILEVMSKKVSSLTDLEITREGEYSTSMVAPLMEDLLKNNSQSLKDLRLDNCRGLRGLTVGVALENLRVKDCRDLTSIKAVDETSCLKLLWIGRCPSVSELAQSVSSTIERLVTDEIPGAFSSSGISFPNLRSLELWDGGNAKSRLEFDQGLISSFSALTCLRIDGFEGLKAIPDTVAKLPTLEKLEINYCQDLLSLPTFDQSHTIRLLCIRGCGILKERCEKENGPEWYKIQHIPKLDIR